MAIEKMEWHEIVSDFIKMLQSLPEKEIKMALGAVAGHYDLGVVSNKLAASLNSKKPYSPKSKSSY